VSFPIELLRECWFLTGPTACGKTATSLVLAEKLNAEIVALDAMTLYRGMDIGTAKPSREEQLKIRHHLIDVLDPHEDFSLSDYLDAAEAVCREIVVRGHTPLFVGGTGLYLRAILRGLFDGPAADESIRTRLEQVAQTEGAQVLHDQLRRFDPETAERLHPNDQRRVIRAIEVYELTGQPLSQFQQHGPRPLAERPKHVYWLSPPRDWLYQRIDARVEQMVADGLIEEVRSLMSRDASLSRTAGQALGYKEVIDWLGDPSQQTKMSANYETSQYSRESLTALIELVQTRTRQFAKRQHTWFRNLDECVAVPTDGTESPEQIADRIVAGQIQAVTTPRHLP
jgi:tRNA dimethylallyltransferase